MDTLPLPPRPDIEQYRKRAKSLVDAANSADSDAVTQWATDWLKALTRLLDVEITPFVQGSFDRAVERLTEEVTTRKNKARDAGGKFALSDAQHLDRKSTRLNSSHLVNSYAVFCLKKKNTAP